MVLAALLGIATWLGGTGEHPGRTVVTVRVWDEQAAAAYRQSFDEFTREHPDVEVRVNVVAYSAYFDALRTDVAGGGADDVFWLSNAYFANYADNGRLLDVGQTLGPDAAAAWEPSVVGQFTRHGVLWGVPQLTDAGIALYYDADLLRPGRRGLQPTSPICAGPPAADDTLRPLLARLTVDADGNRADTATFDPSKVRQWGYNAAQRPAGHLPGLHRIGGRPVHRRRPVRVRRPRRDRGVRVPRRADRSRPRGAPRVGHQRQRRLLPQPVPAGPHGAVPVGDLQPRRDRRPGAVPLGRDDDADGTGGAGQRHQRNRGRGQRSVPPPRRRAPGSSGGWAARAATRSSAPTVRRSPR